ncbi:hypothetical protein Mal15_45400 [Stieleria maiorica]|uniref:DUF998 domain-containing protein n=1 Tax=Stieleria maiorica TaxID=2795974 RepID=A0A5B9MJ43_9BACT|nr:hypothetical protein [Stieleria maiorica]QEG00470.1 hypothetical protein Mal15_45400 [Stieleria maiorica]
MIPELSTRANALVLSFIGIRRAVGISGFLLPIVLGPIGWLAGIPFQDNISSYYHTAMRDIFVGTMCAIAVFLLCYRGHDWIENWTANVGSAAAFGVALFPLDPGSDPLLQRSLIGYMHTISGGVFFLTLACYSLYHFPRSTRDPVESEPHPWERNFIYRSSGLVILFSMAAMGAYLFFAPISLKQQLNRFNFLFWMEWIAVWAFASAWLTKGRVIAAEIAVDLLSIPREAIAEHFSGRLP